MSTSTSHITIAAHWKGDDTLVYGAQFTLCDAEDHNHGSSNIKENLQEFYIFKKSMRNLNHSHHV